MKVRCIRNTKADLPTVLQNPEVAYGPGYTDMPLTIGAEYVVYAMTVLHGFPWFYIHDDDELPYPHAYPAPLFDVVDARLSSTWHFGVHGDEYEWAIWGPPDWAHDSRFYDRLTNLETDAVAKFDEAKKAIHDEVNNTSMA